MHTPTFASLYASSDGAAVFIVLVIGAAILAAWVTWQRQQKSIGVVRCKRCNHVALAKGDWKPYRGIVPVCGKCGSENWVAEPKSRSKPPPLPTDPDAWINDLPEVERDQDGG